MLCCDDIKEAGNIIQYFHARTRLGEEVLILIDNLDNHFNKWNNLVQLLQCNMESIRAILLFRQMPVWGRWREKCQYWIATTGNDRAHGKGVHGLRCRLRHQRPGNAADAVQAVQRLFCRAPFRPGTAQQSHHPTSYADSSFHFRVGLAYASATLNGTTERQNGKGASR